MSDLAERLSRLPQDRRSRLLRQMRGQMGPDSAPARLVRRDHGPRARASFQQEQMWFVDRLGSGEARNNVALSVWLTGELNAPALRRAVDTVVRRHQVLHSRIEGVDGVPWQVPDPDFSPDLRFTDLSGEESPDEAATELAAADAAAPFDLAAHPPLRARLVRLAADRHLLVWVVHHIVWDPGSTRVFAAELTECYAAAVAGRDPDLPELPVDYADFAAWQRERLTAERRESLSAQWRRVLAGSTPSEVVPDFPRSPETGGSGRGRSLSVDRAVLDRIGEVAGERDTTVFTVLLAAFNATLRHWTRSTEVTVGTASASRPHRDLEGLIGCFVSMIPLRTEVDDELAFTELVDRTAATVTQAFALSELPFEQIVEAVRPPRDPLRHPLFQIEFTSLGAWGAHETEAAGLRLRTEQIHDGAAKFDLSVLTGESEQLELSIEYNTDLYRSGTALGLLESFGAVLAQVAADPRVTVGDLRLTGTADGGEAAGAAAVGPPAHRAALETTLDRAFREQAARTPEAVAVRCGGDTVSYAELDRWSEAVAADLVAGGLAAGDPVVLRTGRGPASVAAVLGALKAGGHYVPVPADAPEERVTAIVTGVGARLAVVDAADTPLPDGVSAVAAGHRPPAAAVPEVAARARPDDLAYVLHTSGSSGTPKGVMIEHRSVTHFVSAIAEDYAVTAADRMLHFAPLTFDVSVFEIFTALLVGAELVVADDAQRRDPALLGALMRRERVTVAELPPALMPLLSPDSLPDLRLVSVGGEAFPGSLVAEWTRSGRRFVNGYGPTEATVAVTLKDCVGEWDRNPPIGVPLAGHQAFVLDERLRPVPPGMPGELCVAGPGVARGYLNRPEETAQRFVPNPAPHGPLTERLYRTGDLVRLLPDGDLEFLGRTDRQVKLRGFRIEPGEVEAVLADHPDVERAVVDVADTGGGERVLVAHVVAVPGAGPTAEEVRAHAARRLPGYMVPVVAVLDALPLTPNGKVDRAVLPMPGELAEPVGAPPRDAVESTIAHDIVGPLLGVERVDVDRDFFALGGSSLQATTVVARVRGRFGVDVALADFFGAPTVAALAALVRDAQQAAAAEQERLLDVFAQIEQMSDAEAAAMLRDLGGGS